MNLHPNKPEKIVDSVLTELKLPYKFVGDGQIIIHGKCPDFINCNGQKKIIEVFGDYWHREKKNLKFHQTEKGTRTIYRKYGYQTLVVWESELVNIEKVKEKILEFDKK